MEDKQKLELTTAIRMDDELRDYLIDVTDGRRSQFDFLLGEKVKITIEVLDE